MISFVILLISVITLIMLIILGMFYIYRNNRILDFKYEVYRLGFKYSTRNPNNYFGMYFINKHSYIRLLLSFKSLNLKNWYSKAELEEIRK